MKFLQGGKDDSYHDFPGDSFFAILRYSLIKNDIESTLFQNTNNY